MCLTLIFCYNLQVHLTERENQKLQVWSRMMPYRECFSWAIVPLFDSNFNAAANGSASPSSPLAPNMSGSGSHEGVPNSSTKFALDGRASHSSGCPIIVELSNLNKAKESYTEDSLQVEGLFIFILYAPILVVAI